MFNYFQPMTNELLNGINFNSNVRSNGVRLPLTTQPHDNGDGVRSTRLPTDSIVLLSKACDGCCTTVRLLTRRILSRSSVRAFVAVRPLTSPITFCRQVTEEGLPEKTETGNRGAKYLFTFA